MSYAYLELISKANALVAPLAPARQREWKAAIGDGLPAVLDHIYSITDGTSGAERLAMRLLRSNEVLGDSDAIRRDIGDAADRLFAFWTDDNSNYAAVFVGGPLVGMVTLIDHEEPLPVPLYSSVDGFLATLTTSEGEDWSALVREYPIVASSSRQLSEREARLKTAFLGRTASAEADAWSAHVAMQFLVRGDEPIVRQLLASRDMWVQERACRIVGALTMETLIPELEAVARSGMHNGRIASITALKQLGTDRADEALDRLKASLGAEFTPYFRRQ